jgi:hypothetical protein
MVAVLVIAFLIICVALGVWWFPARAGSGHETRDSFKEITIVAEVAPRPLQPLGPGARPVRNSRATGFLGPVVDPVVR